MALFSCCGQSAGLKTQNRMRSVVNVVLDKTQKSIILLFKEKRKHKMKDRKYFRLPSLDGAEQEKPDDLHLKYILDDGSYVIKYIGDPHGHWDAIYTKYEKDGTQKLYDHRQDLTKIIGADGTLLAGFEYSHGPYPTATRDYFSIYDTVNKKKYRAFGHYGDYNIYIIDCYFCAEREFENGHKRSQVCVALEDVAPVLFPKPEPGHFVQDKPKSDYIKEVYADGTERFYKYADSTTSQYENCKIVDEFMESDGDKSEQYRQKFSLIYEKLPNGTERIYENRYVKKENIPNLVKRLWCDGILRRENFERSNIREYVRYDHENTTSEICKDGTIRTLYHGKLVSENRPNYTHNTVTTNIDDRGIIRAFFPDGQLMFICDGGIYQQWDRNGLVKQKCGCFKSANADPKQELNPSNSALTYYYDTSTEENKLLAAEGWGFVFIDGKIKDLKKNFDECMAKNDLNQAVEILKWMCLSMDDIFRLWRQEYKAYDGISMMARNCLDSTQIKVLDNGLVAFGAIFEDRYFVKSSFMGGIEWYWRAAGIVLDLENGSVLAKCATPCINVRDRYDPNKDKWKHIDTHNFVDVKDGKLAVRLGSYESASYDIDMEKYNQFLATVQAESKIKQTMQQINSFLNHGSGISR